MILVTGVNGLLGKRIIELSRDVDIIGTYYSTKPGLDIDMIQLDIVNRQDVLEKIKEIRPEIVIHCAALTDVDLCEDHKEQAWSTNVDGTKNIADACKAINAKMVYISTDFVFDGKKGNYNEEDLPNPISYYALTKLAGEYAIKHLNDYLIVRSSVIYGVGGKKFVTWVIDSLKNRKEIKVVTNHYNSPTLNTDLAWALLKICKHANGIYHVAGSERISRFEFARKIAKVFGLDENLILPIRAEEFVQRAKRPLDSSLDVKKLEREFNIKLSNVEEGLTKMKMELGVI